MKTKHKQIVFPELETAIPEGKESQNVRGNIYKRIWKHIQEEWQSTAWTYEANPGSFYNAWHYLNGHPVYWKLMQPFREGFPVMHVANLEHDAAFIDHGIWMAVVRVNPLTRRIEDDKFLNTEMQVWLETGEFAWQAQEKFHVEIGQHYHNYQIDCGGSSFEEAVIRMARKVWKFYGNDRRKCAPEYSEDKRKKNNAGVKTGKVWWEMIETNSYGHLCRHSFPPGWQGDVEKALAGIKTE